MKKKYAIKTSMMKAHVRKISKNIASVLMHKEYAILSIVVFIATLALLLKLSSLNTLISMNSAWFIFASMLLTFLISLLAAVNLPIAIYKMRTLRKVSGSKSLAGGFFGFFGGMAGSGCPVCGSAILSLIGISGGLAIFPLKGLELKALGIALLSFSTVNAGKSLDACNACIPKSKKSNSSEGGVLFNKKFENFILASLFLSGGLIIFNQFQLSAVTSSFDSLSGAAPGGSSTLFGLSDGKEPDLSGVDVTQITSTAMAVASLFPELKGIQSEEDAINIMIPAGTPEYSAALGGITFDDPVTSLQYLAKWYPSLKQEIQQNEPKTWQRYLSLAAAPRGISCEFCCGVGPQGVDSQGNLRCGCKHNPAVQSVALGLMKSTDYSDAEVLKEVMRWKSIFFPRNMVGLAMKVAGTDPSQLKSLPGMVGGC